MLIGARRYIDIAVFSLFLLLLLQSPLLAAESPTRSELPHPRAFIAPETISFAVFCARPEDQGVRSLLDTAWQGIKGSKKGATSGFTGILLKAIEGRKDNGLLSFLPLQLVRSDTMSPDSNEPNPTVAVTVTGWSGLQMPLYFMMSRDKQGKPYPTKDLDDATLVLREGWQDPRRSHVLTRVKGTFVSFPSVDLAERCVKALASKNVPQPKGEVASLLDNINTQSDTYGVLLNRKGSLLSFLRWLNKQDVAQAENAVGKDKMSSVVSGISSMTWEGDLVSDNEIAFNIVFRAKSPQARKEVAELLKSVREVLSRYGRAAEMRTTGMGNELLVDFTMVGYKEMLEGYIKSSF